MLKSVSRPERARAGVVASSLVALFVGAVGVALVSSRVLAPALLPTEAEIPAPAVAAAGPGPAAEGGHDGATSEGDGGADAAVPWDASVDGALSEGSDQARRRVGARPRTVASSGDSGPQATFDAGPAVVRVAPGRYKVERAWLERQLSGKGAPAGVHVVPYAVKGKVVGFRLGGVSGGPLSSLGLREGDVLTEVNGRPIDSPDAALGAYRRNAKASRVTLTVLRGGARAGLRYTIE